jgi:hypothetical protein
MRTKSISLILLIPLSFWLLSCNKTVPDNNRIAETTTPGTFDKDSVIKTTTIADDSIKTELMIQNNDSIKALVEKDRKRKKDSKRSAKESDVKIAAYYFHPTARCVTCRNIEAYSIEAIKEWEEQNKKQISWQDINIEDSVNEHYVDEYNLEFSSLVIVKYTGGKQNDWKNLVETWKLVNDKTTFIKYVKFELNKFAKQSEQKGTIQ